MNRVYEQRFGLAVEAARAGATVTFHVEGGFPSYLVWHAQRKRHVISSGPPRAMQALLAEVQAEFARRLGIPESGDPENETERRRGVTAVS